MVHIKNISKSFDGKSVLDNFSLTLNKGKITVLLGPSGCGKSTLCNIIAGLLTADSGTVSGNDTISYLFQEPRLLPWKTVYDNLNLVLKRHYAIEKRDEIICGMLETVDLLKSADLYPSQLSGGMARRVSLARAFIYPGEVVLMDEPFQAIDLRKKLELTNYVNKVWETSKKTALFVTHDISEAILLGDEINVLSESPAGIKKKLENTVPRSERKLGHEDLLFLEKELYKLLLE